MCYKDAMKLPPALHRWDLTPRRAIALQRELAVQISCAGRSLRPDRIRRVAGADVAFTADRQRCIAGVVLWDLADERVVEQHVVFRPLAFPYIPGLLGFREAPALLAAFRCLRTVPDAVLFDGQGRAHPRRLGLASHVGLWLDLPAVGCAKSRLIGTHDTPGVEKGEWTPLVDRDECIGAVLRTRRAVRPLYVSIGHRVDLPLAIGLTLRCCTRYRLPEPTRLADKLVAQAKRQGGQ